MKLLLRGSLQEVWVLFSSEMCHALILRVWLFKEMYVFGLNLGWFTSSFLELGLFQGSVDINVGRFGM